MFIDTHCHHDFPEFDRDREEVIKRALDKGIASIVNIGSSLRGSQQAVALALQYDCIYAAVGIHPHEAYRADDAKLRKIYALAQEKKVVAIGETGLDYFKNYSSRSNQEKLFYALINAAKSARLPLIIHSRQAQTEILKILKEKCPLKQWCIVFPETKTF